MPALEARKIGTVNGLDVEGNATPEQFKEIHENVIKTSPN